MCPMVHKWALKSLDQFCPSSIWSVSLIHPFVGSLSDKGGWDLALVIVLYTKVWWFLLPQLETKETTLKNVVLTIIGMVLALERICLTKRYLSYNGFITCRSFLVTWKGKRGDVHEACNKYSSLELMPVITLSLRGSKRLVQGWQESSISPKTPVHHSTACAWCQLKLCVGCCKGTVRDRCFKWPIRDQMSTAQNDLWRQHSVLAVTSATVSTRWAFPSLFLWLVLNSHVCDPWKESSCTDWMLQCEEISLEYGKLQISQKLTFWLC